MEKTIKGPRNPWNIQSIRKMDFGVSAINPVESRGFPNPENAPRYDMHYALELGLVCSGAMRRYYRQFRMDVRPGQVWLCGTWEPHGWKIIRNPCDAFVLVIWPPMISSLCFQENREANLMLPFTLPPRQRPQIPSDKRKLLLALSEKIKEALKITGKSRFLRLRIYIMEILAILYENCAVKQSIVPVIRDNADQINSALQMVFNSSRLITTQEAARACGLSRNGFSLLFKRLMGIGFSEFSLRYRLDKAASLILQSKEPLKSIAGQYGFHDLSNFSHQFKRYYACSPKDYRLRS